jgi:hypothetical protein
MHVWGESFEEEIISVESIIDIKSKIAESIAHALEAVITPEEIQVIQKIPTSNLTAYVFYLKGREELENIVWTITCGEHWRALNNFMLQHWIMIPLLHWHIPD